VQNHTQNMQLQINITDENKAIFLLELLRSLDYVQIVEELISPIIEQETEIYNWENLGETEKDAIEEGIFQADNNMTVTNEAMLNKMQRWLIK
jgi:hypothetical protein